MTIGNEQMEKYLINGSEAILNTLETPDILRVLTGYSYRIFCRTTFSTFEFEILFVKQETVWPCKWERQHAVSGRICRVTFLYTAA